MNYSFFERNAEKVRKELQKRGIDVLILTHQQKYSYVSGNYHNDFNLGNCIFLWAKEEPTLLVARAEWRRLKYEGYIKDIRFWQSPYAKMEPISFLEVANQIIHEHECETATIAVQMPSIPYVFLSNIEKNFPKVTIIDGEKMINEIMMIKDKEELEITKRVCAIGDAAQQKVIEYARVGITEAELMGHCEQEMRRLGATWYYTPNQCNFGARIGGGDHLPTDRILRRNEVFYTDFHPVWHEYRTDTFRTWCFGKPSKEFRKMTDTIERIIPELNEKLVPGASTKEIDHWYSDKLKQVGYPDVGSVPLGHGIGTGHLPPYFMDNDDIILQPNILISVNSHIYDLNEDFAFTLEYIGCVTEKKFELYTKFPLGLVCIPLW
jgi:Xaa-Pro aminopeptidase